MERALRLWFLALYVLGIVGFARTIVRVVRQRPAFEKRIGPQPPVAALVAWCVPFLILLSGIGGISTEVPVVRVLGVAVSLYAIVMVAWTVPTLGRLLVPGLAVFQDHVLVTAGPFARVRHPLYSGALALWLGAALGTLNWLLLVIWPLLVFMVWRELPAEEDMLRAKFGTAYEEYAARTGRLIPRIRGRQKP